MKNWVLVIKYTIIMYKAPKARVLNLPNATDL